MGSKHNKIKQVEIKIDHQVISEQFKEEKAELRVFVNQPTKSVFQKKSKKDGVAKDNIEHKIQKLIGNGLKIRIINQWLDLIMLIIDCFLSLTFKIHDSLTQYMIIVSMFQRMKVRMIKSKVNSVSDGILFHTR